MTNGETPITLIGNLTSDPELRYTQAGIAVTSFTIAQTPRHFNRQTNEWKDGTTLFLRCSVWREQAEHVAASLTKGSRVIATGVLGSREWEDRETGEKRSGIEVNIDEIAPSLRYATASVTRAQSNRGADTGYAPASQADDSWATTTPGGASYGDETPF